MADDKSNTGAQDRARVAGDEDYEVRHLAEKHGISMRDARALIDAHGNNRDELEKAAAAKAKS
jgi:hypothetical protein